MDASQLATLKTELQTDPRGYGYAAPILVGSHNVVADLINQVRAAISIKRNDISSKEILEAVDVNDYTALPGTPSAANLSQERRFLAWFQALCTVPQVRLLNDDGSNGPVIANLQAMFPAGSATRTRLLALASRTGSRAEELFGRGFLVTSSDVTAALKS